MKILNIVLILLIGNNLMGMRIGDNLPLSPAEWQSLTEMINDGREDLPKRPIRYQNTMLEFASQGNLKGVQILVEHCHTSPTATDYHGNTVLHDAARSGNLELVQWLVQQGADPRAVSNAYTVLHNAAKSGNLQLVQWLVQQGANPRAANTNGMTVLHNAAKSGNLELVQWLVQQGADLRAADVFGTTVLHYAAQSGNLQLVQWLVQQGADPKDKSRFGTVLHYAAESGHLQLSQWLVQQGADLSTVNERGSTILHEAARSGNLELVQWLVQQGADPKAKSRFDETVLDYAAHSGKLLIVQWLVQQGADPRAVSFLGTVLETARPHPDVYNYLKGVIDNLNRADPASQVQQNEYSTSQMLQHFHRHSFLTALIDNLSRANPVRPAQPTQEAEAYQKPTPEMYTLALLKNNGPDPKRPGNDYTSKEFSLASSMLQGAPQNEDAYVAELEKVFSLERALKLLEDITTGEDNSSASDSPPDEGENVSK